MAHVTVSKTKESSQIKTMVMFFDSRRVDHKEFVPPGVTINQTYYLEVLDRLGKTVTRVRTEITDGWILRASS
jgi:hypothetical protein